MHVQAMAYIINAWLANDVTYHALLADSYTGIKLFPSVSTIEVLLTCQISDYLTNTNQHDAIHNFSVF